MGLDLGAGELSVKGRGSVPTGPLEHQGQAG